MCNQDILFWLINYLFLTDFYISKNLNWFTFMCCHYKYFNLTLENKILNLCIHRVATHSGNSGKLREFWFSFFNSGKLRAVLVFSKNFREILRFLKKSQGIFFLDLKSSVNTVSKFFSKQSILFILSAYIEIFKPCG